jgi:hypothetical protein
MAKNSFTLLTPVLWWLFLQKNIIQSTKNYTQVDIQNILGYNWNSNTFQTPITKITLTGAVIFTLCDLVIYVTQVLKVLTVFRLLICGTSLGDGTRDRVGKGWRKHLGQNQFWFMNYAYYVTGRQLAMSKNTTLDCKLLAVHQNNN